MRKVLLIVGGVMLFSALGFGAIVLHFVRALNETPIEKAQRIQTKLIRNLVEPPAKLSHPVPDSLYQRVEYEGPNGKLWAWMSRPPAEQKRHPAIVWIVGGFPPGGLPDDAWLEQNPRNDQSGAQYMRAGVVTLYPTTRGMEGNPGAQESFLGEVADVVAAVQWLRAQPFVDPAQVYVGGHSTGGTLSLLVAASTNVAGVISYGPAANVCEYEPGVLAFDPAVELECAMRSPATWARRFPPAVILEGFLANGAAVKALGTNPSENASYVVLPNCDHFLYVGLMNEYFAQKIAKREPLTLTVKEATKLIEDRFPPARIKSDDGWVLTIPPSFEETTTEEDGGDRVFRNGHAMLVVSLGEGDPVTCEEEGAIRNRNKECFVSRTKTTDDGEEWVSVTAQRGSSLFVTALGLKSQEKAVIWELDHLLDTAKGPPLD